MIQFRLTAALLCVGLVCLTTSASVANVVLSNPSFEAPVVPEGGYNTYPGGSTSIPGWTVVGEDVSVVSGTFQQYGITFQAQDGNQWIDLAGVISNSQSSGVQQIVPTDVGTTYQLDFFVGSATDGVYFFPATIDVSLDGGTTRTSFTNTATPSDQLDWKMFSFFFTAIDPNTTITFLNGGEPNNYNSALDNVTLFATPEPTSIIAWSGLALGACGIYWKRRQA